ncbi:MAG: S8 family serine peptidase, partial [bacterium]|nr:S8 family serine peptidase [bacterium]
MKTKRIYSILFFASLGLVACAGGSGSSKNPTDDLLQGQWKADVLSDEGDQYYLNFYKTASQRLLSVQAVASNGATRFVVNGSYLPRGDKIAFAFPPTDEIEYSLQANNERLVIGDAHDTFEYTRVKDSGKPGSGAQLSGKINLVGDSASPVSGLTLTSVPGEVVVHYYDEGSSSSLSGLALSSGPSAVRVVSEQRKEKLGKVKFTISSSLQGLSAGTPRFEDQIKEGERVQKNAVEIAHTACNDLKRNDSNIELCAANILIPVSSPEADEPADAPPGRWDEELINLAAAKDIAMGSGITVAVLDSGINPDHPDFGDSLLLDEDHLYDYISGYFTELPRHLSDDPMNTEMADRVGEDDEPGRDKDPSDTVTEGLGIISYHGTHVAGIIHREAPGARIVPIRVAGRLIVGATDSGEPVYGVGVGTLYDVTAGLAGAVRDFGAQVINVSMGIMDPSPAEQDFLNSAFRDAAAHAIIVAASGNGGYDSFGRPNISINNKRVAPCNIPEVICVGMTGYFGEFINDYEKYGIVSNHGDSQGLVAPGYDIYSAMGPGNVSGYLSGTSQATPSVAGTIALMLSINPDLTRTQILTNFARTTFDLGPKGSWDENYGYGLLNAGAAVAKAAGVPTPFGVSAKNIDFGSEGETRPLLVFAPDKGINVVVGTPTASWLKVDSTESRRGGLRVSLRVDRTGLEEGEYPPAQIEFKQEDLSIFVNVLMKVGPVVDCSALDSGTVDLGILGDTVDYAACLDESLDADYDVLVQLVNADTGEYVSNLITLATKASGYQFYMGKVPAGNYYLMAGIDTNEDGGICNSFIGEPCTGLTKNGLIPTKASDYQLLTLTKTTVLSNLVLTLKKPVEDLTSISNTE